MGDGCMQQQGYWGQHAALGNEKFITTNRNTFLLQKIRVSSASTVSYYFGFGNNENSNVFNFYKTYKHIYINANEPCFALEEAVIES